MKAKRVYEGQWLGHGMSSLPFKHWAKRWARLQKKAEQLRSKHTKQHPFTLYAMDLPKIAKGTIIRVVIEELVEDMGANQKE